MKKIFRIVPVLGSALIAVPSALAQAPPSVTPVNPSAPKEAHVLVHNADVAWQDAPPFLPPGAKVAVLDGDPGKPGLYTMRLKIPDGYRVAAHWHPNAEHLTIVAGTFHLGMGDRLDTSKATALKPGDYTVMPGKMHHYAWSEGETVVQAHGMGPFRMIYVDPKDDPSRGAKKK
jgi:mannose-6-phosphate isomerase-like protein (cupin superfamily)